MMLWNTDTKKTYIYVTGMNMYKKRLTYIYRINISMDKAQVKRHSKNVFEKVCHVPSYTTAFTQFRILYPVPELFSRCGIIISPVDAVVKLNNLCQNHKDTLQ